MEVDLQPLPPDRAAGDCYCPVCGLPQLVYTADGSAAPGQPERWASRCGMRAASTGNRLCAWLSCWLFQPARFAPCSPAGDPRTAVNGCSRRVGGGALHAQPAASLAHHWGGSSHWPCHRILGGWTAALTGISLYAMRFWLHQGQAIDDAWNAQISLSTQLLASWGVDAQQIAMNRAIMVSPEGHAGAMLLDTAVLAVILLGFSVAGGALGARFLGRPRRIEQ